MAPAADPGPRAEGRVRWPLVREGRFWVWLKGVRELSPAQSTDIGVSEARRPMFKGKNIGKRTRFTARKNSVAPTQVAVFPRIATATRPNSGGSAPVTFPP